MMVDMITPSCNWNRLVSEQYPSVSRQVTSRRVYIGIIIEDDRGVSGGGLTVPPEMMMKAGRPGQITHSDTVK